MKKVTICIFLALVSCNSKAQDSKDKEYSVSKTDAEWKAQLTDMQYHVLREKGTERAGTNKYNKFFEEGTYVCAGCGAELYESEYKYDSGSGWPAFDRGVEKNLELQKDSSLGMSRMEVLCARCGGHLGHVFNDGPGKTTGMRHCVNSAAMNFIPAKNGP